MNEVVGRISAHEERLDGHDGSIGLLWKHKVSLDRYIWVERFVIAAAGAVAMYAWSHLTAISTVIAK